jgi:hypothetical protein
MANVVITVDSVDITDDIIFSDAEFTSAANGRAGTCKFRVRDSAHIYTLVTGKQITLTIDGTFEWGGYISQVQRGYFFDAYDCRCRVHVVPRFLEVHGVDWNVLFQRRYLYNLSDPTDVQLTQYPADTFDSTVINYYVANHLDLTGDGITTSLVEHVGTPSTDAPISGAAGWTWGQFMAFINFNVGAIWYIDPDRVLVYCDVDTPNAPYGISDDPGAGEIGCQNLEISFDGSELANDALVWGMGQGSQDPVFSRVTDYDSLNEHNRWQVGAPLQAIWKQTTADRTANSYVYGSPQNKRGGKDDAVAVRCTVYTPGFRVAQKVDFRSVVFGFEDVIPIRVLRITFPTQSQPKWELTISHAIDAPWTGFDFFPFVLPEIKCPDGSDPPCFIPEPIPLPPNNPCADFVPQSFTADYPANLADYNTSNTLHPGTCFELIWNKRTGTNPIAEYGIARIQQFTGGTVNRRFVGEWHDRNENLGTANYTDDADLISVRSYVNPYFIGGSGYSLTSVRLTAQLIQSWDVDNGTVTSATWELYSCDVGDPAVSHGLDTGAGISITNSEFQTVWGTAVLRATGTHPGGPASTFIDVSWPVENPQYIQFFLRSTGPNGPSTLTSGQSYARYATNDDDQQWASAFVSSDPTFLPSIFPNHVLYLNAENDPCHPSSYGAFYWQPYSWKWNPVTVAWEAGEVSNAFIRRDNTLNYSYYTAWIAPGLGSFSEILLAPSIVGTDWSITVDNQGGLVSIAGKSYSWELVQANWGDGPPSGTDPGGIVVAAGVIHVPAGPTIYSYSAVFPDRDIALAYGDRVELYLRWTSASGAASDTVSISIGDVRGIFDPQFTFVINNFVTYRAPNTEPCCSDDPPQTTVQGEYCANLTRIAAPDGFPTDDSYWEMAGTYQLGTTQVWVDGLFLQQNVDYTEHPDQSFIQIDSSIPVEGGGAFFGAEPGQKIVYACANYQSIYGLIA